MVPWSQNGAGEGVGLVLLASAYVVACTFAVDCNTVDEYGERVCHRDWGMGIAWIEGLGRLMSMKRLKMAGG